MNLQHLKYTVEVYKAGSISGAAQNLYMAQPNLSKAIKDLEKELGFEIFERSSEGMSPTDMGIRFIYHARNILAEMDDVKRMTESGDGRVFNYKISVPRATYLAKAYSAFLNEIERDRGINAVVSETNAQQTIGNVISRGYDFGVIRVLKETAETYFKYFDVNELEYKTILDFSMVIVMSCSHPLAKKKVLLNEDLAGYTKITHGDFRYPNAKNEDRFENPEPFKDADRVIYTYERGSQFELLDSLKDSYMWVSPIPGRYLDMYDLVQKKCSVKNNHYVDVAIRKKRNLQNKYDRLFMEKIEVERDKVIKIIKDMDEAVG
ncbi:MAG TPA: LysR family transcriptional regulator [Lachnospiraceae bacterium]|nr:LysR family transcriptional regulator [Lachnospiraceae bacterium]